MRKISELQVQSEAKVQQERQRFVMCIPCFYPSVCTYVRTYINICTHVCTVYVCFICTYVHTYVYISVTQYDTLCVCWSSGMLNC